MRMTALVETTVDLQTPLAQNSVFLETKRSS